VVEGIVRNDGNVNMSNVYVRVRIYWSSGTLRGETTARVDMLILQPGETSPFSAWITYCCPELIDYHTVEVMGVPTTEEPYREVAIVNESTSIDGSYREYWGEVVNTGNRSLSHKDLNTRVYTVYYDANGRMLERDTYYPEGHLAPSMKAPIWGSISIFEPVASYQRWIQTQPLPAGQNAIHPVITVNSIEPGQYGSLIAKGQVRNPSAVEVEAFYSYAVFRDAQGAVVGFDDDFQWDSTNPLGPRETQAFEQYISSYSIPPQYASIDFYGYTDDATAP
jgi:YD repeat-containing protein